MTCYVIDFWTCTNLIPNVSYSLCNGLLLSPADITLGKYSYSQFMMGSLVYYSLGMFGHQRLSIMSGAALQATNSFHLQKA